MLVTGLNRFWKNSSILFFYQGRQSSSCRRATSDTVSLGFSVNRVHHLPLDRGSAPLRRALRASVAKGKPPAAKPQSHRPGGAASTPRRRKVAHGEPTL